MIPEKLKGTEFEALLVDAAAKDEAAGRYTMTRAGVTMSHQAGKNIGIASKPDFEGILIFPPGRQFQIEAKVCSGASFPMVKDKIKPQQVEHLLKRSKFGALSFLIIHWTARQLARTYDPSWTVAIPITDEDPRWQAFVDAYKLAKRLKTAPAPQGSITREESRQMGIMIPWRIAKGCRKPLPFLLKILDPSGNLRGGDISEDFLSPPSGDPTENPPLADKIIPTRVVASAAGQHPDESDSPFLF